MLSCALQPEAFSMQIDAIPAWYLYNEYSEPASNITVSQQTSSRGMADIINSPKPRCIDDFEFAQAILPLLLKEDKQKIKISMPGVGNIINYWWYVFWDVFFIAFIYFNVTGFWSKRTCMNGN